MAIFFLGLSLPGFAAEPSFFGSLKSFVTVPLKSISKPKKAKATAAIENETSASDSESEEQTPKESSKESPTDNHTHVDKAPEEAAEASDLPVVEPPVNTPTAGANSENGAATATSQVETGSVEEVTDPVASSKRDPLLYPVIKITAPAEVRDLLNKYLGVLKQDPPRVVDDIDRLTILRRMRKDTKELLATKGYFNPVVVFGNKAQGVVEFVITPGEISRISEVDLQFFGDIVIKSKEASGEDFVRQMNEARKAFRIKEGDAFSDEAWGVGKQAALEVIAEKNFASARISKSEIAVDASTNTAKITLYIDSGPQFFLGESTVTGLKLYDVELIQRYGKLNPGAPYSREALLEYQSALQNSPYFSSVVVGLDSDPLWAAAAPVNVAISEKKPKRVTLGAGFSSNFGIRTELSYRNNNFLNRALSLVSGVRVEEDGHLLFADMYMPPSPILKNLSFGALDERSNVQDLLIERSAIGAVRQDTRDNIDTSWALKYQIEHTEPLGGIATEQKALSLDWGWTSRQVDSLSNPRQGYVLAVKFGGANKRLASTQDFVRSQLRYQLYYSLSPRDVLIGRIEGGATVAKSSDGIPQDFLFRTGGAQTVRGYAYNSLGVADGAAIVGGRYLGIVSLEYVRWLSEQWGVASFIDAGDAADRSTELQFYKGVGLGARWASPAGPLALDLAWGFRDQRLRLHFAISLVY